MMNLEVVTAKPSRLSKLLQRGEVVRVMKGLYLNREPSPRELAYLVQRHVPHAVLTGRSAAQLYVGQELTFPLELASRRRVAPSPYLTSHRVGVMPSLTRQGLKLHLPVLAAKYCDDDALVLSMFEKVYAKRDGYDKFVNHLEYVGRLPQRVHGLIAQAALGTDSGAEIKVVRALRARGVKVRTNVLIGPYYWDIVIPAWRVAIEIDSHEFHSRQLEFVRDRWKNNDATLRGWMTLRYTGSCVAYHLDAVVQQILEAKSPNFTAYFFERIWSWHELFVRVTGGEGEIIGFER